MNTVLATHGRPDLLRRTLESLLHPKLRNLIDQIIVIENGGDWGARALVDSLGPRGRLRFLSIPQANKSLALNAGLSVCDDGLVFLTDDDVFIPPTTIRAYHEAGLRYGRGHYFGGPTRAVYEVPPEEWLKEFLPASATGWPPKPLSERGDWDCLGFNWAAFREDLLAVGGFDPRFGPGSESGSTGQESDMQRRLRRERGVVGCFVEDAVVEHEVPKERCSEEWAIRRIYRSHVEAGVVAAGQDLEAAAVKARQRLKKGRLRRWRAALSLDPKRKFRTKFWDSADRGFAEGVRLVCMRSGSDLSDRER